MLNRFKQVKNDSYQSMEDDRIREVRYSVMDDMGAQIRTSNNSLEEIKGNQKLMKQIIDKYKKQTTPQGQRHLIQQFNQYQKQNRQAFTDLKQNIMMMNDKTFQNRGKSNKQIKLKQVIKFEAELQECVNLQLSQTTQIQTLIESKKKRIQQALPPGTTLENLNLLINNTQSTRVRNAAEDLRDKMQCLKRLADSIKQCRQMFEDIALLVESNTHQLQQISGQLGNAKQDLMKAEKIIKVQVQRKNKSRTKKCIIIILGVLVLAAGLIVLLKFTVWK